MGEEAKKPPIDIKFGAGAHNWPEASMFISIVAGVVLVKYFRIKKSSNG